MYVLLFAPNIEVTGIIKYQNILKCYQRFEDTKLAIRNRKSQKNTQCYGQKRKDKNKKRQTMVDIYYTLSRKQEIEK